MNNNVERRSSALSESKTLRVVAGIAAAASLMVAHGLRAESASASSPAGNERSQTTESHLTSPESVAVYTNHRMGKILSRVEELQKEGASNVWLKSYRDYDKKMIKEYSVSVEVDKNKKLYDQLVLFVKAGDTKPYRSLINIETDQRRYNKDHHYMNWQEFIKEPRRGTFVLDWFLDKHLNTITIEKGEQSSSRQMDGFSGSIDTAGVRTLLNQYVGNANAIVTKTESLQLTA